MIRRSAAIIFAVLLLCAAFTGAQSGSPSERKIPTMTMHAEGSFDVKTTPVPSEGPIAATAIGSFALDKQYHGDLDATAKGMMLGAGKLAAGTAGYVAMEQVTGKLHGKTGTFALQHFGTMQGGEAELNVRVVPGSGTGELEGIAGVMTFTNTTGKHTYALDYTLPESK